MGKPLLVLCSALVAATVVSPAPAQQTLNFENLTASPNGTLLTGQDQWTLPTGSTDYYAFLYAGNTLNLPPNPGGGNVFVSGTAQLNALYGRAQRVVNYGMGTGRWTLAYDVAALFTLAPPAADNLGSISLQPSATAKHFISLMRWVAPATPTAWKQSFVYYSAANVSVTADIPDANFTNLPVNKWYHVEVDFNFTSNKIDEIRLKDVGGTTTWRHAPTDWYLFGGATTTPPLPTDLRLFSGGSAGNTLAFDNIVLEPRGTATVFGSGVNPPGSMAVLNGSAVLAQITTFGLNNPLATQRAGSRAYLLLSSGKQVPPLLLPNFGMARPGANGELLIGASGIFPVALGGVAWNGTTAAAIPLFVPPVSTLVGNALYAQGVLVDVGGSIPIGLTDAVELSFGNR